MSTPTILLIPGNMCDASLWDAIRADLRISGWRLVDADTTQDDSIEAMAARALADCSGLIIPIGFSMGGIIAFEIARQVKERLAGLVLLDTNAGADLPERAAVRPQQQERIRKGALEEIVRDELKPNYLAKVHRDNSALKDHLLAMAMSLGDAVFIHQSEALRLRADAWKLLPDITCPTLVACGAEDALCPPESHERMANALPDATVHIVPDSGHMLPLEQPEALRQILLPFLSSIMERETL